MGADEILDAAYELAERRRQEGQRVRLVVEPDERLERADATLAKVREMAKRWVQRTPGVGDGLCGAAILAALDGADNAGGTE